MLEDYEIKRTPTRFEKVIPYIEFIIVLIIIQSVITLFTGDTEEGDAIRFRLLAHSGARHDVGPYRLIDAALADGSRDQVRS
jgi:stage II sporulation protein R